MDLLTTGYNLLLILIGFGLLIFVHELGHFLAAKWAGIRTEAFAVGMGPVICAWRKGIGFVFGSTHKRVVAKTGKPASELKDKELQKHGLGETEYSLRWLPIGGFVKMLGQEDANPNYVSDDPRSYNMRPVGKRMIVVSAGVIMNVIFAVILFVIAFSGGVRLEAPVVGGVSNVLAAGTTEPQNVRVLEEAGMETVGLQSGDRITRIDGDPARTFADVQIASAMGKPGVPIRLTVDRAGVEEPLHFSLMPKLDEATGLLGIGIEPGRSTRLLDRDQDDILNRALAELGLADAGVTLGMTMTHANGQPVETFQQFREIVDRSGGQPVETTWAHQENDGETVTALIDVEPEFQWIQSSRTQGDHGLFGLAPLVAIRAVPTESPNAGIMQSGDVVLRIDGVDGPRFSTFLDIVQSHAGETLDMTVLRDGEVVSLTAEVNRQGKLVVEVQQALDTPLIAEPIAEHVVRGESESQRTPAADLNLMARTRIEEIGTWKVNDWSEIRRTLRDATADALEADAGVTVPIVVSLPIASTQGNKLVYDLQLSARDVRELHELGWTTRLNSGYFDAIYTTLSSDGNPITAIAMGFNETKKLIVLTYLTIDRLFRGSVGVEQLRGPVGIVHIGTQIADKGMMYLIFFLAMISVNLAVINFLPLPIVDGGLFLFLIYEKFKGRPPSIAFQNLATMVGLLLIGAVFLVTFFNDIVRLVS